MPNLSEFLYEIGIGIYMYYSDAKDSGKHHTPHVHIKYGNREIEYDIENLRTIKGSGEIKRNILKQIEKWIEKHQEELLEMWDTADIRRIKD